MKATYKATYKVTNIAFHNKDKDKDINLSYKSIITINDEFFICCEGQEDEISSFIVSDEDCEQNMKMKQCWALDEIDISDIISDIEKNGFKSNYNYLSENANLVF